MIRQGFWDVFRQRNEFLDPSPSASLTKSKTGPKGHYLDHLQHCFDYLQQAILCAGDVTLEGRAPEVMDEPPKINGYGAAHQCKDMVRDSQSSDLNQDVSALILKSSQTECC